MDKLNIEFDVMNEQRFMKFSIPTIKYWKITAEQHVNSWILPDESFVEIILKDIDLSV